MLGRRKQKMPRAFLKSGVFARISRISHSENARNITIFSWFLTFVTALRHGRRPTPAVRVGSRFEFNLPVKPGRFKSNSPIFHRAESGRFSLFLRILPFFGRFSTIRFLHKAKSDRFFRISPGIFHLNRPRWILKHQLSLTWFNAHICSNLNFCRELP